MSLNQKQQEAADGVLKFLFQSEKELIISGAGGYGKTYLISHLMEKTIPSYKATCAMMGIEATYDDIILTATTNQAAEVLAVATGKDTQTIHSLLGLRVTVDYTTGDTKLVSGGNAPTPSNKIIFIDESSYIDRTLMKYIIEGTHKCKIIYVGDHCQLAPVKEALSPIYTRKLPFFALTEPMRNAKQPALVGLCQQLRETVETGQFRPIQPIPGVIDWLTNEQAEQEISTTFTQKNDARIVAYQNSQVIRFNDYIRSINNLPTEYTIDEWLINNNMIKLSKAIISVDEAVQIKRISETPHQITDNDEFSIAVRSADLLNKRGHLYTNVNIPVDREYYQQVLAHLKKQKKWVTYYRLRDLIPDLRASYASTVHKAQGTTCDTVYVDLGDLSRVTQPNVAARLLYVAFTRARSRIVLFGNLATKYGGVILPS